MLNTFKNNSFLALELLSLEFGFNAVLVTLNPIF
jgi:hypothetical protein